MTPFDALDVLLVVAAAVLLPVAGLLAAADAAIAMASPARVEELHREGRRGAASLLRIVSDRPRYTNLLLLLRLSTELTATVVLSAVVFSTWGFRWWIGLIAVLVMIVVCYVVVGVLPRTIGRQHPYRVGLALATATRGLAKVLSPVASLLILLGNAITPGKGFREGPFTSDIELRELVDIAGRRGLVEETEREMLQSVFELGDTIAREVMVPRTEMIWIEADRSTRQALQLASRSGMSRIPVIGEDIDDVVGVAYVKDLIAALLVEIDDPAPDGPDAGRGPVDVSGPSVSAVMRPAVFVPDSKRADELLREMQLSHSHFTVVIDEYGGVAGIVTIEDVLEEIVGEITDEYDADAPPPIEHLDDGRVRVSARLAVEDLGDLFGIDLPAEEVETVGGLLAQLLGRVPLPGSVAEIEGLQLVGEDGRDRRGRPRVLAVTVRRLTPAELAERRRQQDEDRERQERERREREEALLRDEPADRADTDRTADTTDEPDGSVDTVDEASARPESTGSDPAPDSASSDDDERRRARKAAKAARKAARRAAERAATDRTAASDAAPDEPAAADVAAPVDAAAPAPGGGSTDDRPDGTVRPNLTVPPTVLPTVGVDRPRSADPDGTATGPTATGPTATGPTATGPTATRAGATGPGTTRPSSEEQVQR
ncbi:HlyC/CorC family transporter [Nakamurella sp. YIM 132084]|uniref:HlyC/CorC family transporter n=1 Tax=Nakamurella leprariae TaxID=2803911 RepID=A0A938YCZ9_9ACTN|nr:hemolysin family protein [Nakamurella leprariae]MBM9467316.1 HlyC/CorC family transporter [Nakamurella leprariae]